MRRWYLLTVLLSGSLYVAARAADEDKTKLFNTFYLDGENVTHVLTMRRDKSFDLHGPEGRRVSGTIRADAEHVTLTGGGVKRYFHYQFKGRELRLGCREDDKAVKGDLLGEMPPVNDSTTRTLYVCEDNWKKRGRPVFDPQAAARQPAAGPQEPRAKSQEPPSRPPAPSSQPPPPSPQVPPASGLKPQGTFTDLAGTYYAEGNAKECLVITADGCFGYVPAEGAAQNGTLLRAEDEFTFVGAEHRRQFALRMAPGGFALTRRPTDVIKPGDVLGRMPPQEGAAAVWLKKRETAEPQPPAPPSPRATAEPLAKSQEPGAKSQEPAAKPSEPAVKPVEPAIVPVKSVREIAGTFVHKPNPFLAETLVVGEDGSFTYRDSNGANAAGKAGIENDVLVLTSGEVVRRFTVALEGGSLTLTCAKDDAPKYKNDLASMSPTALKTARYEKAPGGK